MVCKNSGIYVFLGTSWVLITMTHRNINTTRALISWLAVARAQYLGQNSRFARQPRVVRSAARDFGPQPFSPQAFFLLRVCFSPEVKQKNKARLF